MEEKELVYYPYDAIEELVNADKSDVTNMLFAMQILTVEDNPNTTCKLGKLCVDIRFRAKHRNDLYPRYFRETFYVKNGRQHFLFEITNEFVDFVKDRIEKVGCLYNVQFKQ
jgi:hypothetical protein